jgi:D-sedoheptulose 7-phosphate isomerase
MGNPSLNYIEQYFNDARTILERIDQDAVNKMIELLVDVRESGGRLFFLGVGGSAANCSHAVNDFRKLMNFETYSPADNVAELTARTNDEGWDTVFIEWLRISKLNEKDCVFILSVGGGSKEKNVSANLVYALEYAQQVDAKIVGIVGRDGGYTAKVANAYVLIPSVNPATVTPQAEAFQSVVWHLISADPRMMRVQNKWESLA